MKRPYFRYKRSELRSLFTKYFNDESTLKAVAHELSFRKTRKARILGQEVNRRLHVIQSGAEAESQVRTGIEMSGEKSGAWIWLLIVPACLSLGYVILGHPSEYLYYDIARVLVTLAASVTAFQMFRSQPIFGLVFVGMALLFNPVYKISLDREIWVVAGGIAFVLLIIGGREVTIDRYGVSAVSQEESWVNSGSPDTHATRQVSGRSDSGKVSVDNPQVARDSLPSKPEGRSKS